MLPLSSDSMMPHSPVKKEISEKGEAHRKMRRHVRRQEAAAAEVVGGWTTPASGATIKDKADAGSRHTGFAGECLLVECKQSFTTDNNGVHYMRFLLRWLETVRQQAKRKYSVGCVAIRLGKHAEDYWAFDEEDLVSLCPDLVAEAMADMVVVDVPNARSFILREDTLPQRGVCYACHSRRVVIVRQSFVEEIVERMADVEG
jgi:hypothetical protein